MDQMCTDPLQLEGLSIAPELWQNQFSQLDIGN